MLLHSAMAATSSYMACAKFSMLGYAGRRIQLRSRRDFFIRAQQQPGEVQEPQVQREKGEPKGTVPRPVETQLNVKSRNMAREYGGDWLSCATRHVRIYAAYIDPETCAFDQTQMDKLTIILDPTNEFVWTPETTNKVYSYFQELVDHYEFVRQSLDVKTSAVRELYNNVYQVNASLNKGADLTEYTLRLIGSDIEHYIRKLLYDGEIKYNMDARVLNFSMGKPRVMFNNNEFQPQDV
ncbi:NAD(P)H-quinone oxidoreductase subunit M, chloroplastic isoform X1 [Rosa rugosa]|uniref:NAD(P)H-quinone oxidoreductase subunit M, chloroplastic isoform X1 n=1 Tax=Rosa rugosa TaxID=74645 RepID=UPI002B40095F|nr:NAD(P)H-quinone oxidoreductase subunit M, chloroplastic isoform X1 [Rosa rugosa]